MFERVPQSAVEAAKSAQVLINLLEPSKKVKVDGVIGPQTRAAFASLGLEGRGAVVGMLNARNESIVSTISAAEATVSPAGNWIPQSEAYRLASLAVAKYGDLTISGENAVGYLRWLLELEPAKKVVSGEVFYDAAAVNGFGFVGLYQVGRSAFKDVQESGRIRDLPVFAVATVDPWLNTVIALVYSQLLISYLRQGDPRRGVAPFTRPITKEILYSAYNQGAIGFLKGAKNALVDKGQSATATRIIAQAVNDIKRFT